MPSTVAARFFRGGSVFLISPLASFPALLPQLRLSLSVAGAVGALRPRPGSAGLHGRKLL